VIEDELVDVIEEAGEGLEAVVTPDRVSFTVADGVVAVRGLVVRRSLTPSSADRLLRQHGSAGVVVADLLDSAAAETLRSAGWSFWDRRGRLRLWLPEVGYRLDVPTRSFITGADGPDPRHPVTGVGGLTVALGL